MSENEYRQIQPSQDALIILKALLATPDTFVSGSLLAEQLGMSRPAIHGKLDKLREQGFEFEAIRNKGYRLVKEPEVLHPDLLRYYTQLNGSKLEVLYFPVIDSTNSEAERQLSHRRKSPFAIASSCQTKGRGRLGREWHSATADNLYLSVGFEPNIPPQALQHFTLWAGIHICRALQSLTPNAALKIKWPNDLHCDGRKFAGMLTEAKMDADSLRSIIFGIGLNVNSNPTKYPSELRKSATSLYAVGGKELSMNQVAAKVIIAIQTAYDTCILDNGSESLVEAWAPLSSLSGKTVTAIMNNQEITGTASGIDETGALILIAADGSVQKVRAGDVTLKK
ncbi:biotin--[acetyl-CoA-carboxylase] ligase [Coraliomargarita sp. SDUM461003]|uniref:Bifunctional ligase/repressor BirA n=1 Tax=Thalassobacterium maritimum TaxID=3041265 RepID=A0ABU1AZA5_9BACT|nr:biotin--[acetyl-CoA-carboxylase] ligase [Coraliomargarita sp. SDUM461003]MDQ8208475.1 biotin--[acetyl-CoA-carboxylase] ligase [Coraliomargarita sp. SDUM461003]